MAFLQTLEAWMAGIARVTEKSARMRAWRFRRLPVRAETILPALAAVAPEAAVADSQSIAIGYVAETGKYYALAYQSGSLWSAREEARVRATRYAAKYAKEDIDRALTPSRRRRVVYDVEAK